MKRIVEVTFDDGSTRQVDDAYLRAYLEQRREAAIVAALGADANSALILGLVRAAPILKARIERVRAWKKSKAAKKNARRPRGKHAKALERGKLLADREAYIREHGTDHGWLRGVADRELVDPGTIKRRIAPAKP